MSSTSKKFAALSAAAVTTTALTVAVVPDSNADKSRDELLRLLADIRPFGTDPQAIPDLTGGVGSAGYDLSQQFADQLIRLIVENVNLSALAQAAGLDPESLVHGLLTPVVGSGLANLVDDPLGGALAGQLNAGSGGTLGGLLDLLGVDLSEPLNLSGVDIPGVNVVTTGPLFTLLKLLGVDIGWVPALPNSVAQEINDTPYLNVGLSGVGGLLGPLQIAALRATLTALAVSPANIDNILNGIPDVAAVRVIPVVGVGLGAFAAGAAYQQVVDDLPNQPGGDAYSGTDPLLGSFTVLPMVLLLNPGRANGGPLARAYPFFRLFGIDTVTPETEVSSSGGTPIKIGNIDTGLALGGANLIPIKLDIGIQNFPASDFAAWPNPVTLANNAAALMFPTYIIRGLDATNVSTSLAQQLLRQTPNSLPTEDKPLSFNYYLTIPINGAPVLEPTYLVVDAVNLLTGGSFNNPIGTALNPVLESAGNLGYTDVERVQNSDGDWEYVRTFDDTEVPTAFGSFPDVEWGNVPGDLLNLLQVGIQQAIDDGIEGEPAVNALAVLLGLLGLDNLSPLGGSGLGWPNLTDLTESLVGNALGSNLQSQSLQSESLKMTSFAPPNVASPSTGSGQTVQLTQTTQGATPVVTDTPAPRKRPVLDLVESLGNSVTSPTKTTATTGNSTSRPTPVKDAVKKAGDQLKQTADDVSDGLKKAAADAQKAVNDTAKKVSDAAKPKNDTAE